METASDLIDNVPDKEVFELPMRDGNPWKTCRLSADMQGF